MKKNRLLIIFIMALFFALSVSAAITAFAATDQVLSAAALQQKIDSGSRDIVFSANITDGGTIAISNKSNVTISGDGRSITGSVFNVTNSSAITFKNIHFIGNVDHIVKITDSVMVKFNDCTFTDAIDYAVKVSSTDANDPSIVEVNSATTSGNGKGFIFLEGGSYLSVKGGVTHGDEVKNQLIEDQIRSGENDKNIGPDGEMGIAIVHQKDDASVDCNYDGYLRPYVQFDVMLAGTPHAVYIVPYDNRAPEFNLLSVSGTEVRVNSRIDLKSIAIADNKTAKADLKIHFNVVSPSGNSVTLTESDITYIYGGAFTPDAEGTYEVKCVAEDLYGNVSHPRYIYYKAVSDEAVPVINSPYIKRNFNIGEKIILPLYKTTGGDTCAVKVYGPDGKEVAVTDNSIMPEKAGVYRLVASYGKANKEVSLNVSALGSTVISKQINVLAITLGTVFGAIFVGGAAVIIVFTLKLNKSKKK